MSTNTDPHQHVAAWPRMLRSGCLQRYVAFALALALTPTVARATSPVMEEVVLCQAEAVFVVKLNRAECVEAAAPISIGNEPTTGKGTLCRLALYQGVVEEVVFGAGIRVGEIISMKLGQPRTMILSEPAEYGGLVGTRVVLSRKGFGYPLLSPQFGWVKKTITETCPGRLGADSLRLRP